jgi:hypothetical protein
MAQELSDFPEELLLAIVESLGDADALRILALTNRKFQGLAELVLYRTIFFREEDELERLHDALKQDPRRAKAVQTIDARCHLSQSPSWDEARIIRGLQRPHFHTLKDVLKMTTNLRDLTLESPYCNFDMWRRHATERTWGRTWLAWGRHILNTVGAHGDKIGKPAARPALQTLTRLTLHLNGICREFWTCNGDWALLFSHPTLIELYLSSVNVAEDTGANLPDVRTPLKRLTLDEANVTYAGLCAVLSKPRALEYLYIGGLWHSEPNEPH